MRLQLRSGSIDGERRCESERTQEIAYRWLRRTPSRLKSLALVADFFSAFVAATGKHRRARSITVNVLGVASVAKLLRAVGAEPFGREVLALLADCLAHITTKKYCVDLRKREFANGRAVMVSNELAAVDCHPTKSRRSGRMIDL